MRSHIDAPGSRRSQRAAAPKRRRSVVVYLVAAFGITIAALASVVWYTSDSAFRRERERAVSKARSAANLVAIGYGREYGELFEGIDVLLDLPELLSLNSAVCNPFMKKYLAYTDGYAAIVLPDGSVVCSTDPRALQAKKPFARAAWMDTVVSGKRIDFTEPAPDVITGKLGLATIVPFNGADGRRAILFLHSGMRTFYTMTAPELQLGTEIVVLDKTRSVVLDRSTDEKRFGGMSVAGSRLARAIPKAGAIVRGVDGVERVYAEQTVKGFGWHVLSGIKTSEAYADALSQRNRAAGLGGASILLVLLLGFTLHRRLAKPTRSLARAIEAAATDPDAKAPEGGPAEIADLATTFNQMNETRRRSEARFRGLVLQASDMIVVIDDDSNVRYCSPGAQALTGLDESSFLGNHLSTLVVREDRDRATAVFAAVRRRPGPADAVEFRTRHADGSTRQVEILLNNLTDDPAVGGVVATIRDITERKAFEQHLAHQALHDPLTNLPNRALVLDRLQNSLARAARTKKLVSVLFMDLDRFKLINDSHGHSVGDRILVMLGDRLVNAVRPSDTVARFGGDEFVAVCDNLADESEAIELADRMAEALRRPFEIDGQNLFLTGSIGVALSGREESAEDLLRNADAAMYRAKERGRAGHAVFDDAMRNQAVSRLKIEGAIHQAIESNAFVLQFQPKVSLGDGSLVGVEALVRMVDLERGIIPPNEFISVAEETGLIVPIGEIVLREAAREALGWIDRTGSRVAVAVNISPRQLAQPSLPDVVESILNETGLPPELLILEITENLLMQDADLATATLERLRAFGVRISIDDFGTGHSSLGYLQAFPIDELKIDRSFTASLDENDLSSTIVGSIVGLAHAIGLSVVAEGVETAAQLAELRRLGCDVAQGFYFSHPRPGEAIEELIASAGAWGSAVRPVAGSTN